MKPASDRVAWLSVALLAALVYVLIGRAFAVPATHVRLWRLAAWLVSGVVYSAHIAYEQFTLRHSVRTTAWHVALAAGIGAFGLALAAALRSYASTSVLSSAWRLAFVAWPLITAIPAFLVALVVASVLARLPRHVRPPA